MGAYTDATITIFIMIPMVSLHLIYLRKIGPVMMYLYIKFLDIVKSSFFQFWLKKERWLKNLTEKTENKPDDNEEKAIGEIPEDAGIEG